MKTPTPTIIVDTREQTPLPWATYFLRERLIAASETLRRYGEQAPTPPGQGTSRTADPETPGGGVAQKK